MALKLSSHTFVDLTSFFHYVSCFIHLFSTTFTTIPGGNLCSQEQRSGILLPIYGTSKNPHFFFFCPFYFFIYVSLVCLPFLHLKDSIWDTKPSRYLASIEICKSKQLCFTEERICETSLAYRTLKSASGIWLLSDRLPIVVSIQTRAQQWQALNSPNKMLLGTAKFIALFLQSHPDQSTFPHIYFIAYSLLPLFLMSCTHSNLLWIWGLQQVS